MDLPDVRKVANIFLLIQSELTTNEKALDGA